MTRAVLLVLAGILVAQSAPAPAPELEIVSPAADAYISGTTMLRARLTPSDAATRVLFSVDGKQVCDAGVPPFECSWEAGPSVTAHQIRVVADLKAGGRVIRTVRTKSLGYAEKVDVDVVQIIATVVDGGGHFVSGLPIKAKLGSPTCTVPSGRLNVNSNGDGTTMPGPTANTKAQLSPSIGFGPK